MQEVITDLYGNRDEEAMYQQALAVPLTDKIQMAIELIRTFENQAKFINPEMGFWVGFSGGKDSIVLATLFNESGVLHQLHNSHTTLDSPELYHYIKKHWPHVHIHKPEVALLNYMVKHGKGMPCRQGRWCCSIFKEASGNGNFKAVGVRASESPRRKGLWQTVKYDNRTKLPVLAPLLYWTDDDIWSFIKQKNILYPSLYDEGFTRLGCLGCPLSSSGRAREFKRWPKYEQMWKRACKRMYEKWVDVPRKHDGKERVGLTKFKNWEEYWAWWMEEENVNDTDQPDCQMFLW